MYFKVRNFRGKKLSRFRGFLAFSRKFFPAKFFKMSQPRKFFPAKFFKMSQPRKFFPAKVFQKGSTAKVFSREIKKINNTTDCKLDDINTRLALRKLNNIQNNNKNTKKMYILQIFFIIKVIYQQVENVAIWLSPNILFV